MLQNSPKKSKTPKFRLGEQPMGTLIFFGEFHGITPKAPMYITNFVQMVFSKTLTTLVCQGFQIQNGGNSISYQSCQKECFKKFDIISMSKKA